MRTAAILVAALALVGCSACKEGYRQECETTIATGVDPVSGRVVSMPVAVCVCVQESAYDIGG